MTRMGAWSGRYGQGTRARHRARRLWLAAGGLATLLAGPATAADCSVPGSRATLQQAVADPACTRILLADQTFVESVVIRRDLEIAGVAGGASTLRGSLDVENAAVVSLADVAVAGCAEARLRSTAGARVTGGRVTVSTGAAVPPCPTFADAFESATTDAWSARTP